MEQQCYVSTDKRLLDIKLVHEYLSNAYWSKGRSAALVEKSIENSLCFGVFTKEGRQIGFARIVTDYVIFAWLMDVFVIDEYQGKGIGKLLVGYIVNYPRLQEVNGIGLRTEDAHGLYEKYGFKAIPEPQTWMLKQHK